MDRVMNNSASNKSSTQPSEERRKKAGHKIGNEQEIVDELVACGKDNANTSYSGMTALIPALTAARLGPGFGGPAVVLG